MNARKSCTILPYSIMFSSLGLLQQDSKEIIQATSEDLPGDEIDLQLNLEIISLVNNGTISIKQCVSSLKSRLTHKNPNVLTRTLTLIDFLVKNCGLSFIQSVFEPPIFDLFEGVLQTRAKNKLLYYIQNWHDLTSDLDLPLGRFYRQLKLQYDFPPPEKQAKLLLETNLPPPWRDSDYCHRCRDAFTTFNRKHHCRGCGGCYCQNCSSKVTEIPKLGIEKLVRVCDSCYDKIGIASTTSTSKERQFDAKEDEDYERAIQESLEMSRKEEELKNERQRRAKQDRERDQEEREIQKAIQESLKLAEQMNKTSISTESTTNLKSEVLKKSEVKKEPEFRVVKSQPKISKAELDTIKSFCELVKNTEQQASANGIQHINALQLQTAFAKAIPLLQKLNNELLDVDEIYRKLYGFNTEIGDVVGAYDAMLRNRFMYSGTIF